MTPETLLSYDLPLFAGLSPTELANIPLAVSEQKLAAWQTIFDQEDDSYDLYFLLSGSLLAVFWTTKGREIVFSRFPVGAYFGELAALDGTPRSLAVVAKTEARVLAMKRNSFLQLFNEVPIVRQRITHDLVARIRTLTLRNMEMTTLSVEERVGNYLLRLAAEQGKLNKGAVIEDAPTHSEIASSIGANREMVSRSISKLTKRGVIKSARQKIEIIDPEALADVQQ
ncbi:MAG: Crp/Fnr family transcriptional regulator [Yoonia sp.]|uniref:Crp/Fnr family transcriptional regulator n=1 Tax=Yoonia sp. TaxID=2212373 RepID=UPI00273E1723|nr:Crp/Fnr family transcriptional regulator [Yoonia sp.]MDP5084618.1 Crp/Fnr family transcriptional regulator [Yoonia sp.]MDP5362385.1 Crp/Fnr family transcriptional regulator [Paracoccaceae bacterium]